MRTDAQLDHQHLWHPFTQQRDWIAEEPLMIERAEGNELMDAEGRRYLDGVSSLWCNVHGHRHPVIDQAVQRPARPRRPLDDARPLPPRRRRARLAAGRARARRALKRVFYSDSGSTAAEVALKMAFQYWQHAAAASTCAGRSFICLQDAYHGDTIGSVSVGGMDLFHSSLRPAAVPHPPRPRGDIDHMAELLAATRRSSPP